MMAWLATQGHLVNRKRVRRLMRLLGLVAIYQRPNTSKPVAVHKLSSSPDGRFGVREPRLVVYPGKASRIFPA
jgi:hypothetical protein